ncbi:MAG: TrbC/VirB2 family protein [Proteobacteria bacterium]|nr:TrbC/VirB2 family protein [Burkholderiales bacterium]
MARNRCRSWTERLTGVAGIAAFGLLAGAVVVFWAQPAFAQSAAAPWEAPICIVARSLSGPVAKAVAVIAIVITGLLIAFGELNGVFKSLLGLVFGVSFALLADQWLGFIRAGASTACFGS